jgi:SAM-dependent methyltransferase
MTAIATAGPRHATASSSAGPATDEWSRILGFILGNSAAWIVDIGLRSGLLERIHASSPAGITAEELAVVAGTDAALTATWCRAAFAYRVLDWDPRAGYSLGPALAEILLDPASPKYLGGRIQFYTALHEDFRAFPGLLRSGGRVPRNEHDPSLLAALANLSRPDGVMISNHVIPQMQGVAAALDAGGSLLDIGSGAGQHLIQYAGAFPAARIEGLELDPKSLELAANAIEEAQLADRIHVRLGDANQLEDDGQHDLVVLSITLHETGGVAEWENVLRRVRAALRPGGGIVVSELPYPDDVMAYRTEPVYQMLAGVQLHEVVAGCGAITRGQLGRLLREADFRDVRVAEQPMPTRHVVIGTR